MRLRWTVVDAVGDRPGTRDVVVRCPRGTTLEAVAHLLPGNRSTGALPIGRTWRVEVGGRWLPPDAVVGMPPLLDGAVLRLGGEPRARLPIAAAHLLELVVTSGPDAGTVAPLLRGTTTLGRAADSDVRLRDPRVSRHHGTLIIGPDGVEMHAAGPTPGPRLLSLDTPWRAGAGRLLLRAVPRRPAGSVTVVDTGEGTREVRPPPRTRTPETPLEVRLPAPARSSRAGGFPLLAVVLPALAAGALAWWTGSVVYLALAAFGPLLVAGSWWTARRDARREGTLGRRAHARACAVSRAEAATAAAALAASRGRAMPDAVVLLDACTDVAGPLWQRHHTHDDAVRVRLGRVIDDPEVGAGGRDLAGRVTTVDHDSRVEVVTTDDDLLAVDLRDGHLGVVDPTGEAGCARFLVGQLVAVLPPTSLVVVPVLGPAATARWGWLARLPHVDLDVGDDPRAALHHVLRLVASRTARSGPGGGTGVGSGGSGSGPGGRDREPAVLVVVDDAGHLDAADLERLAGAHHVGVHLLLTADAVERLPRLCAAVLAPSSPDRVEARLTVTGDGASARVVLDTVAPSWSSRLARALAPLRPAVDDTTALPPQVPLDSLLDPDEAAVRRRWASPDDGLPVPLGVGAHGPVTVDLTTAGPHALVAGTTGSGKSELLRSWLLALAASQPPDRLSLLLVDYKGGATFDDLAGLPHCVGLLTDLDGGATGRVLHSLRAEVRRRERLFAAAGARDLPAYRAAADVRREPVPRLLVVVDEFRVLAEDAPDVLGQFVRLAATGRSLGIHLVLATQRPGGVVSADIRANAALRIALRVQDAGESRDVVERPDAAYLPASAPGRAVVVGAGIDAVLQTAWTGSGSDGSTVSVVDAGAASDPPDVAGNLGAAEPDTVDRGAAGGADTGAARIVAAVLDAARLAGTSAALPPWLAPLPRSLSSAEEAFPGGAPSVPAGALELGVADAPWAQARVPLRWAPLQHGPLLVLGAAQSGRSTTLAAAGRAAARAGVPVVRLSAAPGHEDHVVDVLSALVSSPVDVDDPDADGPHRRHGAPRALLLLDDADELLDPGADPTAADLLLRLLRTGHRDGIGVVVAGGRALASSRMAGAARARLVHRTVDRSDAMVAGVPPGSATVPPLPGRCLAVGTDLGVGGEPASTDGAAPGGGVGPVALEAQVYAAPPDGDPDGPTAWAGARGRLPWIPAPLPTRLDVLELPPPAASALPLGRTGDGGTWSLDLGEGGLVVVAGPARSGRTTALATLRLQAVAAGLTVQLGLAQLGRSTRDSARPGVGASPGVGPGVGPDPGPDPGDELAAAETATAGPADPAHLLLVDDVDRCTDADLAVLQQWLGSRTGPLAPLLHPGATAVLAGEVSWFADGFRGVPALARQAGCGVVLSPGRTDVRDVLGVRGGPVQLERHPGRGLLVTRGQVRRVQVAGPRSRARSTPARPLPSEVTPTGGPPS